MPLFPAHLRQAIRAHLVKRLVPSGFYFSQPGYCPCCDQEVCFEARNSWLRDNFFCSNCGSLPRERALMTIIDREAPQWRTLRIHESSPGERGASLKLRAQGQHYLASQFFPGQELGTQVQGFRNENLERQTFPDNSFDLVITQDVLEHIYQPEQAFAEIARTLKPGGAHIFTVPLQNTHAPSQRRSTLGADGQPNFLYEPEYHGNPINPQGSPVTFHYGFDIVQLIRESSGLETQIFHLYDLSRGIQADINEVLVTRKPL